MDNDTKTALDAIISKIDSLSSQMTAINLAFTTSMVKHSSEIAQLQRESSQLFTFYNTDFTKLKDEVQEGRHAIKNINSNLLSLSEELDEIDKDRLEESSRLDEKLTEYNTKFDRTIAEEEGKKKLWRVIHTIIILIIGIATFYNSVSKRP